MISRNFLVSIMIIGLVSVSAGYGTYTFFSDTESAEDNILQAGTIDIAVDGDGFPNNDNPWNETFFIEDAKPCLTRSMIFNITNVGENPVRIFKTLNITETGEGILSEPEEDWYNNYNAGEPKNDIYTKIDYFIEVDDIPIMPFEQNNVLLEDVNGSSLLLIEELAPGETIKVEQFYHLANDTENWAQGDNMTFNIQLYAEQLNAMSPKTTSTFLENRNTEDWTEGRWNEREYNDGYYAILTYDNHAPEFDYELIGRGFSGTSEDWVLVYYKNKNWVSNFVEIDRFTVNSENFEVKNSVNIGDLPDSDAIRKNEGARIWLIPANAYDPNPSWPLYRRGEYLVHTRWISYDKTDE